MAKLNSKGYSKTQLNSTHFNSCFMNYFWGCNLAQGKLK
jgi:hypothetical protein